MLFPAPPGMTDMTEGAAHLRMMTKGRGELAGLNIEAGRPDVPISSPKHFYLLCCFQQIWSLPLVLMVVTKHCATKQLHLAPETGLHFAGRQITPHLVWTSLCKWCACSRLLWDEQHHGSNDISSKIILSQKLPTGLGPGLAWESDSSLLIRGIE